MLAVRGKMLDLADQGRSERMGFGERLLIQGEGYEDRLRMLEAKVLGTGEPEAPPKQLAAPKKRKPKAKET
jgi:hypothetical protein